jgi:hypothetical protein
MTQTNYVTSDPPIAEPAQVAKSTANVEQNTAGQGSSIDPQAVDYVAGLDDFDSSATSLMSGLLPTGVRQLPGTNEVDAILADPDAQKRIVSGKQAFLPACAGRRSPQTPPPAFRACERPATMPTPNTGSKKRRGCDSSPGVIAGKGAAGTSRARRPRPRPRQPAIAA